MLICMFFSTVLSHLRKKILTRLNRKGEDQPPSAPYDPSSEIPSSPVLERLQIDNMPFESDAYFDRVILTLSPVTAPQSSNKNGKYYTEPTADDTLTPRPPIKNQDEPQPSTSGIGKTGRPWRTVEEMAAARTTLRKVPRPDLVLTESCPQVGVLTGPFPFNCFLQAMEKEIMDALDEGKPDEIMSSAFKLRLTREDIQTLGNQCWLNDEVVNFYMNLLMERGKKENYPSVYAFSTFFYPKLLSDGYSAVKRWTRNVNLFKQDIILVPIHVRSHWTLVVKMKSCFVLFCLNRQYLQEESWEKQNVKLTPSQWTLHSMESHEIPQQLNGSDCGVFMCKYADYVSRDKPITFTEVSQSYSQFQMNARMEELGKLCSCLLGLGWKFCTFLRSWCVVQGLELKVASAE
ncbi:hypothetical protein CIB84_006365 [Bambusicola thoracicus]|uniref:Ubiquitin-like protease family profile domain-containing protein n=1 Tax=Bambusicola thoracicus TaxID=9083 RepID=A0A2P4T0L4_BAMTH|nr:hypothetical protein CIB84_006365 [Bambusicola thoracicus]